MDKDIKNIVIVGVAINLLLLVTLLAVVALDTVTIARLADLCSI